MMRKGVMCHIDNMYKSWEHNIKLCTTVYMITDYMTNYLRKVDPE
jgi:hypothetical protein